MPLGRLQTPFPSHLPVSFLRIFPFLLLWSKVKGQEPGGRGQEPEASDQVGFSPLTAQDCLHDKRNKGKPRRQTLDFRSPTSRGIRDYLNKSNSPGGGGGGAFGLFPSAPTFRASSCCETSQGGVCTWQRAHLSGPSVHIWIAYKIRRFP